MSDEKLPEKYTWSFARFDKVDPDKVAAELNRVRETAGALTASAVVDFAEADPSCELRKCFTWDDAQAARRHRENTARQVIRSLRIVVKTGDISEARRIYVTIKPIARGYVNVMTVKSESAHAALMREASKSLDAWARRYAELQNLRPSAFRAIQTALDELQSELKVELRVPEAEAAEE